MNKVTLEGRCGRDPEVRYLQNGMMVCGVSLCTSNDYLPKGSNDWVKRPPSWHNLTAFSKDAEALSTYRKGDMLKVEGKIQYDEYTAKDGTKKTSTKILCFGVPPAAKAPENTTSGYDEEPPF